MKAIRTGQTIWINVNHNDDDPPNYKQAKVIEVQPWAGGASAIEAELTDGEVWRTHTTLRDKTGSGGWTTEEPGKAPDVQANVSIQFTVTRPDAFDLVAEAGRVVDAELTKLPGSKLVSMSVGPAYEHTDVIPFTQDALRRQWTAECRAVLARG